MCYADSAGVGLKARGSLGGITTIAAPGSAGTIAAQGMVSDCFWGTTTTTLTASATAFNGYGTTSGQGVNLIIEVISVATATATGIVVGDTAVAVYTIGFRNIAGTVTLAASGTPALLVGTNQTTASALTAPVLTITVATNVITFKVSNAAISTCKSEIFVRNKAC